MKIFTDSLHKIAYATDASVYREIPYGVAYPASVEDICQLIIEARTRGTNIIARAGGTSIAGQVVGNGIVADVSKNLNHILEINPEQCYAWVEPGVVRDELNIACKPYGLFFSPETSTSNRCCIGGMFGNNSCGTHSLVYGSTRNHIIAADGVLADGTIEHFESYTIRQLEERFGKQFWLSESDSLIQKIYSQLIFFALNEDIRNNIRDTYPDRSLKRRSCGYAIDEVIESLCNADIPLEQRTINLCTLLAGSEGTLAFVYKIKVSLDPLPPQYAVAICAHCKSLDAAFRANLLALEANPQAVELMDNQILQLSKSNTDVKRFFVNGDPAALLIIELREASSELLEQHATDIEQVLLDSGLVSECTRVYGDDIAKVWNLRKAGLGILNGMKGDAKPTGVIEDTAVAPQRLPAYMADIQSMLKRLDTSCVFYGHISTGELHLRPILNLKTAEGVALFQRIARETVDIVRKHRGTISGEHGDGRLRGEFIPLLYSDATYQLMASVKYCWDADNIFNPHKIIDSPNMADNLRVMAGHEHESDNNMFDPVYNWKAPFDECKTQGATGARSQQYAMLCSVEQCNGSADCRKSNLIGGTLCPAFKESHSELDSTRARANVLREYLYALQYNRGDFDATLIENDVREILASCLACKGCRRECPSGVDMTRLRAEILQHLYDQHGTPWRTYLVAHNADIQHLGSFVPHLYNFFASAPITSSILKKIVGFSSKRSIPKLSTYRLPAVNFPPAEEGRIVFLYLDEFTKYQEIELAKTFIDLLNRLGYVVYIPDLAESGRAAISKGCLHQAKQYAQANVKALTDLVTPQRPLIGIEPSCILTFRDEYPDLVDLDLRPQAQAVAANCLLFDEFLMQEVNKGNITADMFSDMPAEIWLHGHCHQKALVGVEKTAALLNLPKGTDVHVIPSGCCGMAGSFGYEKKHYQKSIAIGEMILFPAVRKAVETNTIDHPVFIAAPGTSCRTQIYDGTGIKAYHPIEILHRLLKQ